MFCTRVAWACLVCLLLCKEEGSSPVSLQLLRGGIWACMRCPCLCLCWVLDRDYVSQLPCVRYYVFVKSSFKHTRRLPSILAGDFNAHHTMWCRSTDRAGRILLDQIENSNEYVIMNKPQIPTTQYRTTIDLTIVHSSIAALSEWSIYDNLISDHYPILLTTSKRAYVF